MTPNTIRAADPQDSPVAVTEGFSRHRHSGSGVLTDLFRRLVFGSFANLQAGSIVIEQEHDGLRWCFGVGEPQVRITVVHTRFYRRIVLGGTVGVGESFMDGDWRCDNLVALVRIFARNQRSTSQLNGIRTWYTRAFNSLEHFLRRNTKSGSRRNVQTHYDLSNDFFAVFLDQQMQYSAAVFEDEQSTLEEASVSKLERICEKLELESSDRLLEIGGGWGGLAI